MAPTAKQVSERSAVQQGKNEKVRETLLPCSMHNLNFCVALVVWVRVGEESKISEVTFIQ